MTLLGNRAFVSVIRLRRDDECGAWANVRPFKNKGTSCKDKTWSLSLEWE